MREHGGARMRLTASLDAFRAAAEGELHAVMDGRSQPLYRMMEYQLGWIDDQGSPLVGGTAPRFHALLCLATCGALGADPSDALPAAAAVELVHLFTQVHDDIQDGSPNRGARPTVWWLWGPAQAINAGDGLHALARLSLFRLATLGAPSERVLEATSVLDQACLGIFEGQHTDLQFQEQLTVTRDAYLRMVEQRAGALPGCAAELGALLASADERTRAACRRAGRQLGVAMQLQRDVHSLWGAASGGEPTGDVLNKRRMLPVVHALEVGSLPVKRELGTLYMKRVLEPGDLPRLVEMLDGVGARAYCEEHAARAVDLAMAALEETSASPAGLEQFRELAQLALAEDPRA